MVVCVAGKNDIAANVLTLCVNTVGNENVLAISNADDIGKHTWQKSLKAIANTLGVPLVSLLDVYEIEDLLFLSVEFDKILDPKKFKTKAIYNIHFSLLPKYKGVYTAIWPLLNGEKETGVTLHLIERGIDTGPIVKQESFSIQIEDTARVVYFKCLQLGYEVIAANLPKLLANDVELFQQSNLDSTYYSSSSINFNELKVNFKNTAYQMHNYLRAFSFQEYQLPIVHGYKIRNSIILDEVSHAKPGIILENTVYSLTITTIDYNLLLFKDFAFDLFQAIEDNDLDKVKVLADLTNNINITNRMGWSGLMIAAYHNRYEIADELIQQGADVNQTNKNGTSVLMYAKNGFLVKNDVRLLKLLLSKQVDTEWRDNSNKSVLDYCEIETTPELFAYFQKILYTYSNKN